MSKKIIIILFFVLLTLILITSFISNFLKNKTPKTEIRNISPTSISSQNLRKLPDDVSTSSRLISPIVSSSKINQIIAQAKVLNPNDLQTLTKLNSILPYQTDDFVVDYSPYLNQYFISKKNLNADQKIASWATENNLSQLIEDKNLFIFTNQPLEEYKKNLEEKIVEEKEKLYLASLTSPTPSSSPAITINPSPSISPDLSLLIDFIEVLFSIPSNFSTSQISTSTGQIMSLSPSPIQSTNFNYSSPPKSLNEIFNEVGQKVGVPPKILEAVMRIECPPTFNLSSDKIALYSQPGGQAPLCLTNSCSATGTMQMTIGVDDQGNPSCPRCGLSACPNQWAIYGGTIRNYGYSHQPNPLNIKDIVYSAAAKLKNESGATNPLNWTQPQVYRAAERYYGRCDDKHRYSWLGNRTYCEYVWWYYTSK